MFILFEIKIKKQHLEYPDQQIQKQHIGYRVPKKALTQSDSRLLANTNYSYLSKPAALRTRFQGQTLQSTAN
jgi:hypothetical protein